MSRGLLSRNPGDKFKSRKTNNTIVLEKIEAYPSGLLHYQSNKEMKDQVLLFPSAFFENSPDSTRLKAFIVSWFTCSLTGETKQSIRFVEKLKPNITDVFVPNQVFNNEYSFDAPSANKVSCRCSPQDILPDTSIFYSKSEIITYIQNYLTCEKLREFVTKIIEQPFTEHTTPKLDFEFSAFRDVFCELIHPVILSTDSDKILFSTSKNNGLWDSKIIKPNNEIVLISSKGGKYGAEASIKNLIDLSDELSWLNDCISHGQLLAPYYLAHYLKLIDDTELGTCLKLIKESSFDSIENHVAKLAFSPFLSSVFERKKCKTPECVDFALHLTASVAHTCCSHINNDVSMSDKFSQVLKTCNLKQIYSHLSCTRTEWIFKGFEIKDLTSGNHVVKLSAQKTYSSTQIKGNFTFSIL